MMSKMATRDAYGQTLVRLGEREPRVVVLDADLAKSTKTIDFAKSFPQRFFDMGIAEQNLICTAAGLALAGKIPFASTFAVFATGRAFEQIRNSVAYPRANVKIAATHAGLTVGEDGASHQSVEDIAIMRSLPGMTVLVPADARETELMVEAAAAHKGPVYIRLGRSGVPQLFDMEYQFAMGKSPVLREGDDAAIFACGIMVAEALTAARQLAEAGLEVTVVNVSSIKPMDEKTIIEAARQAGAVVTAEEHSVVGGLGSAVAELLARHYPVPVEMVGVQDTFGESGSPSDLLQKYGLTAHHIARGVERVVLRKKTISGNR